MRSVTIKTLLRNEITSDPRPGGSCRQALAVGLWVGPFVLVHLCWKVQGVQSSVRSQEKPGVLEVPDWLLTLRARLPTDPSLRRGQDG